MTTTTTISNETYNIRNNMKPLPVTEKPSSVRQLQEDVVLAYLQNVEYSVCAKTVFEQCKNIPFVNDGRESPYTNPKASLRKCTATLKRLEAKGKVLSTIYHGVRIYSVPVNAD